MKLQGFEQFEKQVNESPDAEIDFKAAAKRGDLGSVEAFCEFARGNLLWERDAGAWYYRDEKNLWQADPTKSVACQITGRVIDQFTLFMADHEQDMLPPAIEAMYKWANRLTSNSGREGMLRMARGIDHMWVDASQWDANPYAINFPNGLLDVRTGEFRPPAGEDLLTKVTKVNYDPTAKAPIWQRTLKEVFSGDPRVIEYFQRCIGYTALGLPNGAHEQKFFICYGQKGGNGKNTIMDPLKEILGSYSGTAGEDTFNVHNGIPEDLHDLRQTRMVIASEPGQRVQLNEEMVKAITGNVEVRTRRLYENSIVWAPKFCVWMLANKWPRVPNSNSLFRRFVVFPFLKTFSERERKLGLASHLVKEEASGIMNWIIEGARRWMEKNLDTDVPLPCADHLKEFRESTDILLAFLLDECELPKTTGVFSDLSDIHFRYQQYCRDNGYQPLGKLRFTAELGAYGVEVVAHEGVRCTQTIRLRDQNRGPAITKLLESRETR